MKRMIKLSLTVLFLCTTFLALPEKMHVLKVEAAEDIIENDSTIEEVILKVEVYLSEYLKEFPADDLGSEKIYLKEYITRILQADYFTEEEIIKIFEIIAENRQEELIALTEMLLDEEPLLSKNALISKLIENNYSEKEIERTFESVDVDWQEPAVKASEEYINAKIEMDEESYSIISRKSLFQFLVGKKEVTREEAIYGIVESTIDWDVQAFKQAKYYLSADAYSKKSLIEKLIAEEFTKEEAEYGVTETQTNWAEQAIKMAESHLAHSLLQSKMEVFNYLQREGFVAKEITHAVNILFIKDAAEEKLEVKEPSVEFPPGSVPERPVVSRSIEFITSHIVISAQAATNKLIKSQEISIKHPSLPTTDKGQPAHTEKPRAVKGDVEEETEELADASLFDNPIFTPVIMVLIVGNLYLFQKS